MSDTTSLTLAGLETLPKTACVGCPNAVWHMVRDGKKDNLQVFCRLMHALIDQPMTVCDGTEIFPKNA